MTREVRHHNPAVGDLVALQHVVPSRRMVYNVVAIDQLYLHRDPCADTGYTLTETEWSEPDKFRPRARGTLVTAYRLGPAVGRHPKGAKRHPLTHTHRLSWELEPA